MCIRDSVQTVDVPSSSSPPSAAPRLLYVEDEAEIAGIVVEMLGDEYDVDHASTGEDGLRLALGRRYDVIVVDRRLPGMSGVDLVGAVRTARIATPALMLTALGAVDDRVTGLDAGADWQTNPATQIAWGLGYISGRYGSPCGAWSHSQSTGWY